jgi:endogenous inhibitor of DNA gyrase (YacG/DUF329 family)
MDAPKDLCENCKAPYERKTAWQRFCSNQCRLESWILTKLRLKGGGPTKKRA